MVIPFKTPSRGIVALCVAISLLLNFFICRAVGFSNPPLYNEETRLRINLMSMAAPAVTKPALPAQETRKPASAEISRISPVIKKENITVSDEPRKLAELAPSRGEEQKQEIKKQKVASVASVHGAGMDRSNVIPLITDATYRRYEAPVYPSRAIEMGHQGTVLLHALVSGSGDTESIKIARSSGYGLLDRAALAAVKKWEFEPSKQNGRVIRSWVQVPVEFVLQR